MSINYTIDRANLAIGSDPDERVGNKTIVGCRDIASG